MALSLCSPLCLVLSNTKSSRQLAYSAKKVDGVQHFRRHSHAKKLAPSAKLTKPNSSSKTGKEDSLPSVERFEMEDTGEMDMRMEKLIVEIKEIFNSMEDGDISPSAYDTAWVARVPAVDGSGQPQFPQTLEWIVNNQLADGSWGDARRFLASDRFLNTLSCLITLTIWKTGHIQVQRGLNFMKSHAELIMREASCNQGLLKGFEMVFLALVNEAKLLGLDLPDYDSSVLKQTEEKRNSQLKKISTEELHAHPSSMLYYVEGIQDIIDWQKILKLQSGDGSFLSSPASTACVYMHTGDEICLEFLTGLFSKFEDHVPCMFPVDISERLRAVDAVERLGLERHFESEIKQALDYVFNYWNPNGLGFGRESVVPDIEVTANGLRLLRMYGYRVSSDVLDKMYANEVGKFSGDQKLGGLLDVLSLYRCSQVNFPGEKVMPKIRAFAEDYMAKSLQNNDFSQVQAVKKNIKEEIEYGMLYPWNRTMPRLMYRNYIEQLSSEDLWKGKTLYHMPNVNNEKYLELAKLDYNYIQALHREEIPEIKRWYKENNLRQLTFTRHKELPIYWSASVIMFEPEYSACRINYTKGGVFATIIDDVYDSYASLQQINIFNEAVKRWDPSFIENLPDDMKICFMAVYNTLNNVGEQGRQFQGRDVLPHVIKAWMYLLLAYGKEAEWAEVKYSPSLEEYWKNAKVSVSIEAIILTAIFCTGQPLQEDLLAKLDLRSEFLNLVVLLARLINDLRTFRAERDRGELASCVHCYINDHPGCTEEEALNYMYAINEEALVKLNYEFLNPESDIPKCYRKLLFNTTRVMQLFYRNIDGFLNSQTEMKEFMGKCLFEPVQ